jgi:hypothetical protein
MDIEKAVAKESANLNKNKNPKRRRRSLPVGAPPIAKAGLKISFKPAELNQTTNKTVIQQVIYLCIYACL